MEIKECGNCRKSEFEGTDGNISNSNPFILKDENRLNDSLDMLNSALLLEENVALEEAKTKKTNSTGDMTPNHSFSVTSNLIDQIIVSENLSQHTYHRQQQIKELQQREKEILRLSNNPSIKIKPFKEAENRVSSIYDNLDKYFILPQKTKGMFKKLSIKQKKI